MNNHIKIRKAFINGNIYTVNEKQKTAEAVLIENDKIVFVGSDKSIMKMCDDSTEIIDLNGKFMMPGFNDSHLHFVSGGFYLMGINLRPAKSIEQFINLLAAHVQNFSNKWVTGGRWDNENWSVKKLPSRNDIDEISLNTPVFVSRMDAHSGLANTKALELAGITKDTPNPAGGFIEKDAATGELTGILKDTAMNLVSAVIPDYSIEDYYEAALTALKETARYGITSVQDILFTSEIKAYDAYRKLEEEGKLTCRISIRWPIDDYKSLIKKNISVGYGNKFLKLGCVKAFSDGSLGSGTAWFFDPYEGEPDQQRLTK